MANFIPQGVITAIVTPFKSDLEIDFDAFEHLIEFQIERNVDGIVVCGSTGESATLSHKERLALIIKAIQISNGRVPIIAGTGTNDTKATIELSTLAKSEGADALLLVAPYYNKPTQLGLLQHYLAISEQVDLPQIIYNVPGRTAVNITADTQIEIAKQCKNVVATKEASGNLEQAMNIIKFAPENFVLLCGDDALTLPLMSIGAKGIVSVLSNFAPTELKEMVQLALSGDFVKAREVHYQLLDLMQLNFIETNPVPVKAALGLMGLIEPYVRLPLVPIAKSNLDKISNALSVLKLL
ncbi:MAG TPA: 4-hydroxy-tetrahydrodipicolinate synthase [Candidatus Kapabacteria bacterium]|nr:4-hydroxy-tetrahydrodipicolinate synthase [Candidatus Kapabacteria bacterium]